jgi:hypothetical protein
MRDIIGSRDIEWNQHGRDSRKFLRKLGLRKMLRELNLDVSAGEFLSAERAFTYADLYAMVANKNAVVWLTPHAAVVREDARWMYFWEQLDGAACQLYFNADGKGIVALARSREHLLEISDVVLRLLAASAVYSVSIDKWNHRDGILINARALAYLMEHCQSLKILSLESIHLDENHCRVLGAYSRPDLEIEVHLCTFSNAGARTLTEVLGRNEGPTGITWRSIDNLVLADGLRGNTRLKSFTLIQNITSNIEDSDREVLAIADALNDNKGLVELELNYALLSDEAWDAICDSLGTHPTLQVWRLRSEFRLEALGVAPAVLKSRTQALVNMLKVSTSIHTMHLDSRYSEHKIIRETVIPYLETNRLRLRLLAIQKTRPVAYRAKILGRALLSARTNPNRFWMLLLGNPEVSLSSTTARSARNFSTLATVGADLPLSLWKRGTNLLRPRGRKVGHVKNYVCANPMRTLFTFQSYSFELKSRLWSRHRTSPRRLGVSGPLLTSSRLPSMEG